LLLPLPHIFLFNPLPTTNNPQHTTTTNTTKSHDKQPTMPKIVLAGATGFIGSEILEQCLTARSITHIYCLTRRPLAEKYSTHPKVTQVLHDNFDDLPDVLFERFRGWGVGGCIWALGAPVNTHANLEEAQKTGISYPVQAAEKFARICAPNYMETQTGSYIYPFRFIFMSFWGAEENQFRSLWVWGDTRRIKGAAEKGLFEAMDASEVVDGKKCLDVISFRVGGVLAKGDAVTSMISMGTVPSITVDRLAAKAIHKCVVGDVDNRRVLENAEVLGEDWAMGNSIQSI
jgi:nucleoside-diphosphate-sugar epimerase